MIDDEKYDLSWADVYPARPGRSGDIKVVCPFCRPGSKNPGAKCLSVNQSTGQFMCHDDACPAKGVIVEERGAGRPMSQERHYERREQKVYVKPDLSGSQPASEKVLKYMESRGVSRETCSRMRIHSYYDSYGKEWLGIPYTDRSGKNIHHVKYRGIDEKVWRSTKDTEHTFFGLQTLEENAEVIYITESEIDAITLVEAGFSNVLSLSDGSNGPTKDGKPVRQGKKLDCLASAERDLVGAKRVVLAIDNDPAGQAMAAELAERIGIYKAAIVPFPDGVKDANEMLLEHGVDQLRRVIGMAKAKSVDGVSITTDYSQEIWEKRFENDNIGAFAPSLPMLGELFRLPMGLLVTVTGPPGAGKSSFLRALLLAISGSTDDFPIAFFAPEDAAVPRRFFEKFVRLVSGNSVRELNGDEYQSIIDVLEERIVLVHPDSNSLDDILYRAEYAILNHGIKILVIDPWTEVVTKREYGDDPVDHLNKCLTRLQDFARKKGITVIVSAHPTKEAAMQAINSGKLMDLYSVSGTASWNNKSDIGISIRRSTEVPESIVTEVHTVKIRDIAYGKLGMVELAHNPATGQYRELSSKS